MAAQEIGVTSEKGIGLPVDLIRTVAMILVILLHAANEATSIDIMSPAGVRLWWTSNVYTSIAVTCVPLFVMLTGALLLQPSKTDEPLRVFFKKRWNRIGIPVLFWTLIYFAWNFSVRGQALTAVTVAQGLLVGPYVHFWYIYLLVGLYLLTPIIRVIIAHANWITIKYLLLIWLVGSAIIPLLTLWANISPQAVWFKQNVFLLGGLIGYFIFGAFSAKLRVRSSILYLILVIGSLSTLFASYLVIGMLGEQFSHFFIDALSFTVIMSSVALFLILAAIPRQTINPKQLTDNRLIRVISQNTLPIYLFHFIILETLQKGYLGLKLSVTTLNPIIEIPLITLFTLFICLAIIVPIKKIPYVKRIIG